MAILSLAGIASSAAVVLFAILTVLWLPTYVIRLRVWLFTLINGPDGMSVPNHTIDAAATRRLYENPAAKLRSTQRQVGLSDLFWWLLEPGSDIHQEHSESGTAVHASVSAATKVLLAHSSAQLDAVAEEAVRWRLATFCNGNDAFALLAGGDGSSEPWRIARLRNWLFPMVARFWFVLCFQPNVETKEGGLGRMSEQEVEQCVSILAASGTDVIDALKALKMRDMRKRSAATALLERLMRERPNSVASQAYATAVSSGVLTSHEAALALQGVIFHTGTVQLTDSLTHLILGLAQYSDDGNPMLSGWDRVVREARESLSPASNSDDSSSNSPTESSSGSNSGSATGVGPSLHSSFLERSMHEALRVWPLFGVAHRIVERPIDFQLATSNDDSGTGSSSVHIPPGTVLCFDYSKLHSAGLTPEQQPQRFLPDRWLSLRGKDMPNYIPFGVPRNRPCPAQRLCLSVVPTFVRALALGGLRVWSTAEHSRSLPGRGVVVLQLTSPQVKGSNSSGLQAHPALLSALQATVRAIDLTDGLRLSLTQLACGTLLVLQARRAALAHRYHWQHVTPRGGPVPEAQK